VTEDVYVGALAGYVIGRKGATIRWIAASTGASVKVSLDGEMVSVSASSGAKVAAATEKIRRILAESSWNPRPVPRFLQHIQVHRLNTHVKRCFVSWLCFNSRCMTSAAGAG